MISIEGFSRSVQLQTPPPSSLLVLIRKKQLLSTAQNQKTSGRS
jgi:hypothetical protein